MGGAAGAGKVGFPRPKTGKDLALRASRTYTCTDPLAPMADRTCLVTTFDVVTWRIQSNDSFDDAPAGG